MNLRNLRLISQRNLRTALLLISLAPFCGRFALSAERDADAMLRAVNAARAAHQLRAVALDEKLTRAATVQARYLARTGRLQHQGPDGSNVGDRVQQAGYVWSRVAENLEQGRTSSPSVVVRQWLASPGHRRNLLNPAYTDIGVAHEGAIWVLVLARPEGR